jgi:hypothetical protein
MTFADARAAALAAFIKRYEPQYPTSRRFNDELRYDERRKVFEAVKEILADPDIGTEKKNARSGSGGQGRHGRT